MKADKPDLFKNFKWTTYPTVTPGSTAHPTIGGIDLTISSYSKHKDLAQQAALCLRNPANQLEAAVKGGLPPTLKSLYQNPTADFPLTGPAVDGAFPLCSAAAVPVAAMTSAITLMISDGDGLRHLSLILAPSARISAGMGYHA